MMMPAHRTKAMKSDCLKGYNLIVNSHLGFLGMRFPNMPVKVATLRNLKNTYSTLLWHKYAQTTKLSVPMLIAQFH